MRTLFFAVFGVVLIIAAYNTRVSLVQGELAAKAIDKEETSYGIIDGPLPCKWDVTPPERVQSEGKSQSIFIKVINDFPDEECESTISLRAPGFDVSPVKEEQKISLKAKEEGSMSWIISPRKTGTYEIAVSDALNSKVFGINVTNMFGLSAVQAKSASILGTIFGPMLTVPWWWEKWFQRKKKDEINPEKADKNPIT